MLELDFDGGGSFEGGDIDVAALGVRGRGGDAVDFYGAQGRFVGGAEAEQELLGRLSWVKCDRCFAGVCFGVGFVGHADVAELGRHVVGLERFGLCKPCSGDGPTEVQRAVVRVDEHVSEPGDGVGFVAGFDEHVV